MSFVVLAFKSAFRNPLRTLLTAVGIAIALVSFLFLRTVIRAWYLGAEAASSDRLVARNRISLAFPLPLSYVQKVKGVPGVSDIGYLSWFGGIYKDERNFFPQFATDAESLLRLYPEFVLTDEERQAFLADQTGCIVGEQLATQNKWKVGDTIVLQGTIYQGEWKFTVRGIYKGREKITDTTTMYFHWKYLDESQFIEDLKNRVGVIVVKVADASGAPAVGQQIDKLFANSPAETKTESEKAFQLSFVSMAATILLAIQIVSFVVLFILFLILGNTLAMSTRERVSEYGAMRAIGFKPSHIVMLVIGEGVIVGAVGIALGLATAIPLLKAAADFFQANLGQFLGAFDLDPLVVELASVASLVGAVIASVLPAVSAGRLKIVDALRRIE